MSQVLLLQQDARQVPVRDGSVHLVVTSPPYWNLRDYGESNQIGLEKLHSCGRMESNLMKLCDNLTPEEYEYVILELQKYGVL